MKKYYTYAETIKRLKKKLGLSENELQEYVKSGKLKVHVKHPITGVLKRYRIDNFNEDGSLEGDFLDD